MRRAVIKRSLSLVLLLLFLFSLFSCGDSANTQKTKNRVFYDYFDTVSMLYDYSGMDSAEFSDLANGVEASIEHYHRLFDAYHEYDGIVNIATLNRLAGNGPIKTDAAIIDLLLFSREMFDVTGGSVNFAMGAVTYLWKTLPSLPDGARIPTEAELSEAGKHISPDSVIIDKKASTVEITDQSTRLDLGAIAKGYTAELIKSELTELGYTGLVLDLGGNLSAVGSKPSGEGWNSGIRNPLYAEGKSDTPYARTVTLLDDSLVTSGVYERYHTVDGKRYHHIIDTKTLMPESRYLSVSIQTSHSGVADALSTAIFNMTFEDAQAFITSFPEALEVTFIFSDGSVEVLKSKP